MAKRKGSRYSTQASQLALVRFGPQITALQQLAQDAADTYKATTSNARVAAAGTRAAVDRAAPELAGIYDHSNLAQQLASGQLTQQLGAIQGGGAGLDAIRAGAAQEMASLAGNLATSRASALSDLAQRRIRASEGAQFAAENARQTLVSQLTKIAQQQLALGNQQGAFEASTISDLMDKQAQRDFTAGQNAKNRANSRLVAGVDASGQVIPGGKADKPGKAGAARLPGGAKLQTTAAHSSLMDKLDAIKTVAAPLAAQAKKEGHNRAFVARLLVNGVQGGSVHDPATGRLVIDKNGLPRQTPTIKPQNQLLTSVTLDLLFDGHVSHNNAVALHKRGYSLKALGLPGPPSRAQRQRTQRRDLSQANAVLGALGAGLRSLAGS